MLRGPKRRMRAPEILPVLKEKVRTVGNFHQLCDYFYALALLGTDEAYAMIEHYAREGNNNQKVAAQKTLERYPRR